MAVQDGTEISDEDKKQQLQIRCYRDIADKKFIGEFG